MKITALLTSPNLGAKRRVSRWVAAASLAATAILSPVAVQAQDNAAANILRAMSNYVASQDAIAITYDSDIEVLTAGLQKLQFTNSGQLQLSRPNKLHASRVGGYTDVEFFLDGSNFTVHDRGSRVYAQAPGAGSVDQVIASLRDEYLVEAPGADLLLSNSYERLTENVVEAMHVGQGVIDGVECEHLAFRTEETDWQIWVEIGQRPIPRKYVITSKTVTGAPQYTLRIKEWKTDALTATSFVFTPPEGAKKVGFKELAHIDEVPEGTITGAAK